MASEMPLFLVRSLPTSLLLLETSVGPQEEKLRVLEARREPLLCFHHLAPAPESLGGLEGLCYQTLGVRMSPAPG